MLSGKWLTTCCGVFRRILGIHLEMSHRAGCLCARELPAASEEGAPPFCSHVVHITTPCPARPRLHTQGAAVWSSVPDVCTALHLSHPRLQHNILWDDYQTLMINVCIQFQWSCGYSCPYTRHPCCRLFMVFLYSVPLHMDPRKKPGICSLLLRHFSTLAFLVRRGHQCCLDTMQWPPGVLHHASISLHSVCRLLASNSSPW